MLKQLAIAATIAISAMAVSTPVYAAKIRIALAETPSDELAAFFVALDRAKAMGLDYEWTAFADEELAIQAILSGQMDIGFGTPYSAMLKSKGANPDYLSTVEVEVFPGDVEKILLAERSGRRTDFAAFTWWRH